MAHVDRSRFRQDLLRVSEGLNETDLQHVIHLCRDVITRKETESIATGYELFELLQERGKLNPTYKWYLMDLLLEVNQVHLLDHLGLGNMSESERKNRRHQIDIYRLYLTRLAMELSDADVMALKSTCNCHKEEITQFYQLINFLENKKKISPKGKVGIGFLLEAFTNAGLTTEGNGRITSLLKSFKEELESEEYAYRMTSKPKGVCVIINNVDFPTEKKRRTGSDEDADRLQRLFGQLLSFEVKCYKNQTSGQMISTLKEISKLDHWVHDCFICCVLSHGSLGSVFGVDDVAVQIKDLLHIFSISNCRSLEGKPKVFFFQACQGERFEKGPGGLYTNTSPTCDSDVKIDDTAPSVSDLEPDLLLGYATPPGFRSYRHVQQGSWYIQELVKSLKKWADKEDILSILTKVNSDVASKEGVENMVSVKQTPCPSFTLAKKLYLANPGELQRV